MSISINSLITTTLDPYAGRDDEFVGYLASHDTTT